VISSLSTATDYSGGATEETADYTFTAATPSITLSAGTYNSSLPKTTTITVSGGAPVICYSFTTTPATNGGSGCNAGTLYSGAVTIPVGTYTFTAIAGGTGYLDGSTSSAAYTITPTWASWNGKTVGITSDDVKSMNGVSIGTSTGNIKSWNSLASPNTAPAPMLAQYIGKPGNSSVATAELQIWNYDSVGPRTLTSGSTVFITGEWPNVVTSCTSPCAPGFTDNNSNTLATVFTVGSGTGHCYDGTYNHQFSYEQNIGSSTTYLQDNFAQQVTNNVFDSGVLYNVATSGGPDASSCLTGVTPSNNTAPNISGTGLTLSSTSDTVIVEIDDQAGQPASAVTSITVPSGCKLLNNVTPPSGTGMAHWVEMCTPSSTSFTPSFTVAQSSHDTFTIYAVAFKSGSGGTAPTTGPGVLASTQLLLASNSGNITVNVPCPSGTTSMVVPDDSNYLSSITDSNSNSWTNMQTDGTVGSGSGQSVWYSLGMNTTGFPNTYQIILHTGSNSGYTLETFFCLNTSHLDTLTAGTNSSQTTGGSTSGVYGTNTQTTGTGNCKGTAGSLVACTEMPELTATHSGDLFVGNCTDGQGPVLQESGLSGLIQDYALPSLIADITNGDEDGYSNGNAALHYYSTSTGTLNFGWNVQQNAASVGCVVLGTY
jgi:hypothetical protein